MSQATHARVPETHARGLTEEVGMAEKQKPCQNLSTTHVPSIMQPKGDVNVQRRCFPCKE